MVNVQPRIPSRKGDAQNSLGFWDTNRSPNLGQTTKPSDSQQKKRTCQVVDSGVPADHWVKLKESEKKDKYIDLARELKKLWNMKATVIPILIGALGTVIKGLEDLEMRGLAEAIPTTPLLRSARILRRVLETWSDLLSLRVQWGNHLLTLAWKTPKRVKIIIIVIIIEKLWKIQFVVIENFQKNFLFHLVSQGSSRMVQLDIFDKKKIFNP